MFTGMVITSNGAENIAALELKELIKATHIKTEETVVKFKFEKLKNLEKLCYWAQSVSRVIVLLDEFKVSKNLANTVKNANLQLENWIKPKFKIESKRIGVHNFNSVDIASEFSKLILKYKAKIDYDDPDVIFYLYIYENKGYFGIDFAGVDLSKRQYKIFNHPEALKGTTGYVLVRESGFKKNQILIDPFMGSGVIVIEAALYEQNFPVQYYNNNLNINYKSIKKKKSNIYGYDSQLRYLKAAQKNSKLAGIKLNLSKIDVEWLDTKFDKNSVDLIVSDPPRMSKHRDKNRMKKTYNELFYQADYILKKKGKVVLLINNYELIKESAKNHRFKISKKSLLNQGKELFNIITFIRE